MVTYPSVVDFTFQTTNLRTVYKVYNVMRQFLKYLFKPKSGGMKLNLAVALSLGLTVVLLSFQTTTSEWTAAGTGRPGVCSATMSNGRVLITGGENSQGILNRVDIMAPDGALTAAAPMLAA